MFELVFQVLAAGLGLWQSTEARKYQDRLIKLKKDWYDEFNRPYEDRDHAVLDNIERELRIIGDAFSSGSRK